MILHQEFQCNKVSPSEIQRYPWYPSRSNQFQPATQKRCFRNIPVQWPTGLLQKPSWDSVQGAMEVGFRFSGKV